MKTSHPLSSLLLIFTITIHLAACGVATPAPTGTPIAVPSLTPSFTPTNTELPPIPSETSTPTPIPVAEPPDGLRMAYTLDGDLYFQDGSKPLVQLTNGGEDWHPLFFSENGEMIYFLRGVVPDYNLYSIDVERNQEKVIVTNSLLQALGMGYDGSTTICNPTLVPNTPLLLFETCVYPQPDNPYYTSDNSDLLAVNSETGEIKRLLPPGRAIDYSISPDGTKVAINSLGRIDIININGSIFQHNIVTYTPSEPIFLPPDIHWTEQSNALIIILPAPTFYDTSGGAANYTVWKYVLGSNSTSVQIPINPMPKGIVKVSPDGNWIIYHDELDGLYIGNLRDGSTTLYESQGFDLEAWSPDNLHFIYGMHLGSVNASPFFIAEGDFIGWLDARRYLYFTNKNVVMGEVDGESKLILTDVPRSLYPGNPDSFIFAYQPLNK